MKKIVISLLVIFLLLFTNPSEANTSEDIIYQERLEKIGKIYDHIDMPDEHILFLIDTCYSYSIDPDLILAIIWKESGFNHLAKNKNSSASGYGQLIRSTALSVAKELDIDNYSHENYKKDPYTNLLFTIHYFNNCLYYHGGDIVKALYSYRGRKLQSYVSSVLNKQKEIKKGKKK